MSRFECDSVTELQECLLDTQTVQQDQRDLGAGLYGPGVETRGVPETKERLG